MSQPMNNTVSEALIEVGANRLKGCGFGLNASERRQVAELVLTAARSQSARPTDEGVVERARQVAASFLDPDLAGGTIKMMLDGKLDEHLWVRIARAAIQAIGSTSTPTDVEGLRNALDLARNRLRAAAINEAVKGGEQYYEYSAWADEADAALRAKSSTDTKGDVG